MAFLAGKSAISVLRSAIGIICAGCIAGMIVCAATHHVGGVVAIGCVSSVAIIVLLATTMTGQAQTDTSLHGGQQREQQAQRVELLAGELIGTGATESAVRNLIRESVRLGRETTPQ